MLISFIIPLYNVKQTDLYRCLNSIYSQSDKIDEYEVICVDDCSTIPETASFVKEYKYHGITPSHLTLINHHVNKRQGGARNTAILHANGEYVFYIDQDDYLYDGCIDEMINSIHQFHNIDIIMFDSGLCNHSGKITKSSNYSGRNKPGIMTGSEFLSSQEIPWTPWHYLYRKNFLITHNIKFEENVRFEDVDYVMRCTANAKSITFLPITAIIHSVSEYQTSTIGNSIEKIIDLVKVSYRTGFVALEEYNKGHYHNCDIILAHHYFGYKSAITHYLWRLPYSELKNCLKQYPPIVIKNSSNSLKFINRHPYISAFFISCCSPIFKVAYWAYSKLK